MLTVELLQRGEHLLRLDLLFEKHVGELHALAVRVVRAEHTDDVHRGPVVRLDGPYQGVVGLLGEPLHVLVGVLVLLLQQPEVLVVGRQGGVLVAKDVLARLDGSAHRTTATVRDVFTLAHAVRLGAGPGEHHLLCEHIHLLHHGRHLLQRFLHKGVVGQFGVGCGRFSLTL